MSMPAHSRRMLHTEGGSNPMKGKELGGLPWT